MSGKRKKKKGKKQHLFVLLSTVGWKVTLSSVAHTGHVLISGSSPEVSLDTQQCSSPDSKGLPTGGQHMRVSRNRCSRLTSPSPLDNTVSAVNPYQPAVI